MRSFHVRSLEGDTVYDGTQLAPHWIYRTTGLLGDALVAFEGPAQVPLDHMVDVEDVQKKAPIASDRMLHFIGEWFREDLEVGVLLQHLLVAQVYEQLLQTGHRGLSRRANDVFLEGRKMSVSIATRSPVSVLVHAAFNLTSSGTPLPTSHLGELGLTGPGVARGTLEAFARDYDLWQRARVKVTPR